MLKCPLPLELAITTLRRKILLQWESKILTSQDFEWLKRGWVQILNGIWNPESQTIWNPIKWLPFCQNHLKSKQKRPDSECSSFRMVGIVAIAIAIAIAEARPIEIWPSKSQDFKCFRILNGHISDPHCTWNCH